MPRKRQKPLGIVPLVGIASLPKISREEISILAGSYQMDKDDLAGSMDRLAANWRMDMSVYAAATDLNISKSLERLVANAREMKQDWESFVYSGDEGAISIYATITHIAVKNGLADKTEFERWLAFLSELLPEQIGYDTALARDKQVVPLRRLLRLLVACWSQYNETTATAYWSPYEEATKTNKGGDFVLDAAELITRSRPTPDQLREAFREVADVPTGGEHAPTGDDPAP